MRWVGREEDGEKIPATGAAPTATTWLSSILLPSPAHYKHQQSPIRFTCYAPYLLVTSEANLKVISSHLRLLLLLFLLLLFNVGCEGVTCYSIPIYSIRDIVSVATD